MFSVLQIKSDFVSLEIRAPKRTTAITKSPNEVTFNLHASAGFASARWSNDGSQFSTISESLERPFLLEDTQYRIHVKSLVKGQAPALSHRDPLLFNDVDIYPEEGTASGVINFRRQVGVCTLNVTVAGKTLKLTFEVFPSKLDYASDYKKLLGEVSNFSRGLALEYIRSTFHRGKLEATSPQNSNIEWLTLLKKQLQTLQSALTYINLHPKRQLVRTKEYSRINTIRKIDSGTRHSITTGKGKGEFIFVDGVGRVREKTHSSRCTESVDTAEHRWLRTALSNILLRLAKIYAVTENDIRSIADKNGAIPKRLQAEERELSEMITSLNRLINLPALNASRELPPPGFASLTLLSGAGYSEAYRAILTLQLGLNTSDGDFSFSVSDVHQLYEVWCFIRVVQLAVQGCEGKIDTSSVIEAEERGIRIRLRAGKEVVLKDTIRSRTVVVAYNQSFDGPTGNQKPDITITFKHKGHRDLILVLDAKYRVDRTLEYTKRFGMIGPPIDAVNALHRYRDAIFLESDSNTKVRPVIKGVALFPATASECSNLNESSLFKSISTLGIGALPFLPGNTLHVQEWLTEMLAKDHAGLSDHGPIFSGWLDEVVKGG